MCSLEGGQQLTSTWDHGGGPLGDLKVVVTAQGGFIPPQQTHPSWKEPPEAAQKVTEQCLKLSC